MLNMSIRERDENALKQQHREQHSLSPSMERWLADTGPFCATVKPEGKRSEDTWRLTKRYRARYGRRLEGVAWHTVRQPSTFLANIATFASGRGTLGDLRRPQQYLYRLFANIVVKDVIPRFPLTDLERESKERENEIK